MNEYEDKPKLKQYRAVKHLLTKMPERYFRVFEFRNGITNGTRHSQRETGEKFQISRERVGQLEARVWYEVQEVLKH